MFIIPIPVVTLFLHNPGPVAHSLSQKANRRCYGGRFLEGIDTERRLGITTPSVGTSGLPYCSLLIDNYLAYS